MKKTANRKKEPILAGWRTPAARAGLLKEMGNQAFSFRDEKKKKRQMSNN